MPHNLPLMQPHNDDLGIIPLIEGLIGHGQKNDHFNERCYGWNQRPTKKEVENAQQDVAEIKMMCTEATEQKSEDRRSALVFATSTPRRRTLLPSWHSTRRADHRPTIDSSPAFPAENLTTDSYLALRIPRRAVRWPRPARGRNYHSGELWSFPDPGPAGLSDLEHVAICGEGSRGDVLLNDRMIKWALLRSIYLAIPFW